MAAKKKSTVKKTTDKKTTKKKVTKPKEGDIVTNELIKSIFTKEKVYRWETYIGGILVTAYKSYPTEALAIKGCKAWIKANIKV